MSQKILSEEDCRAMSWNQLAATAMNLSVSLHAKERELEIAKGVDLSDGDSAQGDESPADPTRGAEGHSEDDEPPKPHETDNLEATGSVPPIESPPAKPTSPPKRPPKKKGNK